MKNDRKYIRVDIFSVSNIKRQAITKQLEEELKIKVLNIGIGGIYVETQHPLPIDTLCDFDFKLPESNKIVSVKGMVTWVNRKGLDAGMGLKFIKVSTEDKNAILEYIQQRLEAKGLQIEEFFNGQTPVKAKIEGFDALVSNELKQKLIRTYFKEIGFDTGYSELMEQLGCDETELDDALKDYEKNGLVQIADDRVKFFYSDDSKLRSMIENWIRENGI